MLGAVVVEDLFGRVGVAPIEAIEGFGPGDGEPYLVHGLRAARVGELNVAAVERELCAGNAARGGRIEAVGVFEVVEVGDGDFGARGVSFLEQNFVLGSTEAAGVPRASASRSA